MLRGRSNRTCAVSSTEFDVVIIGAGAAGMMCAGLAAQRGRRVLLIEHATKLAEKIRISGGGRCNFTNRRVTHENFLGRNPQFTRSALVRYTPQDFIELVERHGIAYHERDHGQLFCDGSAREIIDLLRTQCDEAGVTWAMPAQVTSVARRDESETDAIEGAPRFDIATDRGTYHAHSLVIATGGLSIPKIGATPFGYHIAEQFGLPMVRPMPALVPLTLAPDTLNHMRELAGSSVPASVECAGGDFSEAVLVTHRGLSGPAILQISSYWQQQAYAGNERAAVTVDLLPGLDVPAWLEARKGERALLGNLLAEHLPRRFAHAWCDLHGWSRPFHQLSEGERGNVAHTLENWQVVPAGTQGYAKAEVTLGGVDTRALSSKTMEARTVPGLFFIGEVMDVTGHLGGFNFQWAWASAHAAAGFV